MKRFHKPLLPILGILILALFLSACGGQTAAAPATAAPAEEAELPTEEGLDVDLGALLDEGVPLADAPKISSIQNVSAPGTLKKDNASAVIDYSNTADGYVMVKWTGGGDAKIKVLVKGPTGTSYQYNLRLDGQYEAFPLSDGNGSYTVGVYKNTSGTKYSTALSATMDVKLKDEFAPFVHPNQYVDFNADSKTVAKAVELCKDAKTNLEKVDKVYTYVINNIKYDYDKAKTVQSGYVPKVDEVLAAGKGICFDYAALMSAMLRSQGVPTKLVVGYTGEVYHAWISVYSEGDGWVQGKIYFDGKAWKLMDPTFASTGGSSTETLNYIGNGANYQSKYLY
ncbi:MAG: transglutaminase domain-containing protein [Oscillospiraceae bacterium]|nr:transglutaminase domain-containing protein [Oscillospiraceae bacterium]